MKKIANASDFYPLISALTILIMKVKVVLCWSFAAILSLLRPIESLAVVSIWKRIWSHCLEFNNFKLFVDLAAFWSSSWRNNWKSLYFTKPHDHFMTWIIVTCQGLQAGVQFLSLHSIFSYWLVLAVSC